MQKPDTEVDLREALNMEIIISQALIDLLVSKGIISQEELMARIKDIRREMPGLDKLSGAQVC